MQVTEKSNELKAAEFMVYGFARAWTMQMLQITIHSATGQDSVEFPFMPHSLAWRGNAPVRGYFSQNWPALTAYLLIATPSQQVRAAQQILKLRWNGNRPTGSMTKKEYSEAMRGGRKDRSVSTSYRLSRAAFKSRNDWNTVK